MFICFFSGYLLVFLFIFCGYLSVFLFLCLSVCPSVCLHLSFYMSLFYGQFVLFIDIDAFRFWKEKQDRNIEQKACEKVKYFRENWRYVTIKNKTVKNKKKLYKKNFWGLACMIQLNIENANLSMIIMKKSIQLLIILIVTYHVSRK